MAEIDVSDIEERAHAFCDAADNLMRFVGRSGYNPCRVEAAEDIRAF
ncbi:hypothetical protein [Rhizobium freirei]|nr:hypothetical protein [Rhizobium freirei]